MKEKEKPYKTFILVLKPKKGEQGREVKVVAKYCYISARGDMYFTNSASYNPNVVAAFHAGSWDYLKQEEKENARI